MPENPVIFPTTKFQDWVKNPMTVVFGIMSILLSVFSTAYWLSNEHRQQDCANRQEVLQTTNDRLTNTIIDLTRENYALKLDNSQQNIVFDSVARQKRLEILNKIKD